MVASSSKSSLSPRQVHRRLVSALTELEHAQRNAVLLFAEATRRKIYRDFGYSSIYQYAELELGFKKTRTAQFLRLAESLEQLPQLRESLARGDIAWTKAREVATVATPRTESQWITKAKEVPSRILEREVRETRLRARSAGGSDRAQVSLEMQMEDGSPATSGKPDTTPEIDPETPVGVSLRMTAGEYARYQALLEALRSRNAENHSVGLILAGLEKLVFEETKDPAGKSDDTSPETENRAAEFPRGNSEESKATSTPRSSRSPYQVIVHECPQCNNATMTTSRGEKSLSPRELRTILCDAQRRESSGKNKTSVPPRLRRAVLERDRYRCRSAGCGRTSFLAVHHRVPREAGGPNTLENLVTLCSGCHRALHTHV